MTHNRFIGLRRTQALLREGGLRATVASTTAVPLSAQRLQALPAALRRRHAGSGLHRLGPHAFAEFHVLEIAHLEAAG
jgi:hypothetical protein